MYKINKSINIGRCKYTHINKDWIIMGPIDNAPTKNFNIFSILTEKSYKLSNILKNEYTNVNKFHILEPKDEIIKVITSLQDNCIFINIVNNILYIIETDIELEELEESNETSYILFTKTTMKQINNLNIRLTISKFELDSSTNRLYLIDSIKDIPISFVGNGTYCNLNFVIIDELHIMCIEKLKRAYMANNFIENYKKITIINIEQLTYNSFNMIKGIFGCTYKGKLKTKKLDNVIKCNVIKTLYDYWKRYTLIPMNFENNKYIIFNYVTGEEYTFDGHVTLKYNVSVDDYEYISNNNGDIKLFTFHCDN